MHRETPSHCDRASKLPSEAAPSAAELTRAAEHDGAANRGGFYLARTQRWRQAGEGLRDRLAGVA